jgi:trehalose synthase
MIRHYRKRGPWIWHCHIDPTDRDEELWHYLRKFIEGYDAVVFSLIEYKQELDTPQVFFTPALDPFNIKNREMDQKQIQERLDHYNIPTDLPIITQISRFDSWKDPEGVIEAFKLARQDIDATLVLLGNVATDDPEGEKVYHSLLDEREDRLIILSKEDTALVNALQRRADVVLQKSLREGFGLTVTEAMWKGTPVIGGNVGGIKKQIKDGENGFLVSSPEQAAKRIVQLVKDEELRASMGEKSRESVREKFLMTGLLENYLDLLSGFERDFRYLH